MTVKKKDQYPRVQIVWIDAESAGDDWAREEDCIEWAKKPLEGGDTIGRLVFKGKDHVVVYGSMLSGSWLHGIKIPCRWIKEIRYLDER